MTISRLLQPKHRANGTERDGHNLIRLLRALVEQGRSGVLIYQNQDDDWVVDACQDLGLLFQRLPHSRLLFVTDSKELRHLTLEAFLLSAPPPNHSTLAAVPLKEACFTITHSARFCIGKLMRATDSLASIVLRLHLLLDGFFLMSHYIFEMLHTLISLSYYSVQYFCSRSIRFIVYSFCMFSSTLSAVISSICHFCLLFALFLFIVSLLDCRVVLTFHPLAVT
jgi:hypothetical protein